MSRTKTLLLAFALALASGALTSDLHAQVGGSRGMRFEASVLRASLSGSDFEGVDAGIGFDGLLLFQVAPEWDLGLGVQWTSHDVDFLNEDYTVYQFFAEPRYRLPTSGTIAPYLFGRAGYVRVALNDVEFYNEFGSLLFTGDFLQTGMSFGAGIGLAATVSPSVQLHASAAFHRVSLGDAEFEGDEIDGTDASGTSMVLRAGLTIGFGGGASMLKLFSGRK